MASLRVGTSGWIYKHWAASFYPRDVGRGQLAFFATKFETVELNASFYRLPTLAAARAWHDATPPGFLFAMKGSRFITHMKKLNVTPPSIAVFFERLAPLAGKAGPVLWQLPPNLHKDLDLLDRFLSRLPTRYRYAVEFRHQSWYDDEATFEVLRHRQAAHVCTSSAMMPARKDVTTDFTYIRFHGLTGFAHDYSPDELLPWATFCRSCLRQGVSIYAYFNNDENVRAPKNAADFRTMVRPGRAVPARLKRKVGGFGKVGKV